MNYINSQDVELSAHGFLAGQFWCELMAVALEQELQFLAFWSIIENTLGYIDESSGKLWPTYHHFKLAATNLKGTYHKVQMRNVPQPFKALCAADGTKIAVMLLNQQNDGRSQPYRLEISFAELMQEGEGAELFVPGVRELKGSISYADEIAAESTELLLFDYRGKLLRKYIYSRARQDQPPQLQKKVKDALFVERN